MAKNAKVNATGRNVQSPKAEVETVVVPAEAPKPEVPSTETKVRGRVIRGHKYDGKSLSEKGLSNKLQIGKSSPKAPRGNGKPSVMYRVFSAVSTNPGITVGDLITEMKSENWAAHPTPYGRKDEIEDLWCFGYIKGAMAKNFLAIAE